MNAETIKSLVRIAALHALTAVVASSQLYVPQIPQRMWDAWISKEGENYHLFSLMWNDNDPRIHDYKHKWTHVGHAVSNDLINWQGLSAIPTRSQGSTAWDRAPTLTGSMVKHDGLYWLFYGSLLQDAHRPGEPVPDTPVGLMTSVDGMAWERHPSNPVMNKLPPYAGRHWRDPFVFKRAEDGLWHAILTAGVLNREGKEERCIAHLTSTNLVDWQSRPPLFQSAEFRPLEVPSYFTRNGYHYIVFNNWRDGGNLHGDTSGRKDAFGMYYVVSRDFRGPYRLPENPLLLGSGNGRKDACIGRVIDTGDEVLLHHNTMSAPIQLAAVKQIEQNADGALRLVYWPGLDKLQNEMLMQGAARIQTKSVSGAGLWSVKGEEVLGEAAAGGSILWLPVEAAEAMITLTLDTRHAEAIGLVWCGVDGDGLATVFHPSAAKLIMADVKSGKESVAVNTLDEVGGAEVVAVDPSGRQHIRVLVRSGRSEVFLNGRCHYSFGNGHPDGAGRIGLYVARGRATFGDLQVSKVPPLKPITMPGL